MMAATKLFLTNVNLMQGSRANQGRGLENKVSGMDIRGDSRK